MPNEHYILISCNKCKSLVNFSFINNIQEGNYTINYDIGINLGENINLNFIDNDLLQVTANDFDIRIDVDISSLEKAIEKFRSENIVTK